MTNEEFQGVVLEELKGLKKGQIELTDKVDALEKGQIELANKVDTLEKGQIELTNKVDAIYNQTADLTEFKEETGKDIKESQEDNEVLKEMVGRHEIEIKTLERKIG